MKRMAPALSILHMTDLHIMPKPGDTLLGVDTNATFHAVLDHAFAEKDDFDLILLTGDLAQDPNLSSYQRIRSALDTYSIPCLCLPGNHDDYILMRQILNSGHVSCRKQLFIKNWQIICLNSQVPDSPGGHLAASELAFLEGCLKQKPGFPALIAVHHHCLKTRSVWMDTMMIDNSQELFLVASRYPEIKAIVFGHIHQTMELRHGSIRIFGTPSTCFQFKPNSRVFSIDDGAPGYRIIHLYADGDIESTLSLLAEKASGLQIDSNNY